MCFRCMESERLLESDEQSLVISVRIGRHSVNVGIIGMHF